MKIHSDQSSIPGAAFRIAQKKTIYAWFRGEEALYIGAAKCGFGRLERHPVIDVYEPVLDEDVIIVIPFEGEQWELFNAERELILNYRPKYNSTHLPPPKEFAFCPICTGPYIKTRANQIACSMICRSSMTPEERLVLKAQGQSFKQKFPMPEKLKRLLEE